MDLWTEENVLQFWKKALNISENNGFSEAKLPWVKSEALKLGGGKNQTMHTLEDHYQINVYFSILDNVIMCMNNKFLKKTIFLIEFFGWCLIQQKSYFWMFYNLRSTKWRFDKWSKYIEQHIYKPRLWLY